MSEIKDFILHLRLNYNFLILSAPFLLGALYLPQISDINNFLFLFVLTFVFLFGGANAYNSYFDKDEGPIGGLESPPTMKRWMYYAAWVFQMAGLVLSLEAEDFRYSIIYFLSFFLSWLYSSPISRFKNRPLLSFIAIGIGAVFNSVLMGYIAAGGNMIFPNLIFGALGATFLVLSMYPFSQIYQTEEDKRRGDITFAIRYGISGVKKNYLVLFLPGVLFLAFSFRFNVAFLVTTFFTGVFAYIAIWQVVKNIKGDKNEYRKVMRTKYYGGVAFTLVVMSFLVFFLVLKR